MIRLYYLSILIILLPPFVIFGNPLLGTHSIAKIIWLISLVFLLIKNKNRLAKLFIQNSPVYLSLLFFVSQTASFFFAQDRRAFFYSYEDFLFGMIFFYISILLNHKMSEKAIFLIIKWSLIADITMNVCVLFFTDYFFHISKYFIHPGYMEFIRQDFQRGRLGIENFNFCLLAIFIFGIIKNNKVDLFENATFLISSFLIFISNFRSKAIVLMVSVLISFFIKPKKNYLLAMFIMLAVFVYFGNFKINKYNVDVSSRYSNSTQSILPIRSREVVWSEAVNVGAKNLLGVGLGNIKHFIYSRRVNNLQKNQEYFWAIYNDPHNKLIKLFVETGILGLSLYVIMLFQFIKTDFDIFFVKKNQKRVYVLGFWSLIAFSLFNPSETIKYQMLFWLMRAKIML